MYVYTDHNLPQGESKLKIETRLLKMLYICTFSIQNEDC